MNAAFRKEQERRIHAAGWRDARPVKSRVPLLLLLVCGAGFAFGMFQLFKLRFENGDVYPAYSSLRSDPLGTMALWESLERMPGLIVRRDFAASNELPDGRNTTYLHLAATAEEWEFLEPDVAREIDAFVAKGGRLAITFFPETSLFSQTLSGLRRAAMTNSPSARKLRPAPAPSPAKKKKRLPVGDEDAEVSVKDKWGWELGAIHLAANPAGAYQPARVVNQTDLPLPASLDWHSALILTNLDASWQTIYARGTNAVVAERRFGSGAIVLATDSYFLSNEAMRKDRHADLLAWLLGPNQQVVFDEAHLGLVESSGVATLARKYRLQWLCAGLLLLAGLFVWKNAFSFVPPYPEETTQSYVVGKDAAAGFVNLLRRNVAPRDLLGVCFSEWTKSLGPGNPHLIARVDQAQAVIEKEAALPVAIQNPVRAYRKICEILKAPSAPAHTTPKDIA